MTAASFRTQEQQRPLLLLLAAALLVSTIPSTSAQNSCTANCPTSSRPVCANNKKFSSECHARCAGYVAITPAVNGNCNTPSSSAPKTSQSDANQLNRNSNTGGGNAPCTCPRIYNPVCGVDGSYFPNPCLAKCVGVQVSDQKPKDGKCGYILGHNGQNNSGAAVGAANGNTAPQQAGSGLGSTIATAKPQGSMQGQTTSNRACNCPGTTDFVCGQPPGSGNMAVTYQNSCMAKCLSARILRQGPCSNLAQGSTSRPVTPLAGQSNWQSQQQQQRGCNCPRSWQPVCSATGETFGNACAAYCAGDDVAYEGECQGPSSGSSSSSSGLVTGTPGLIVPLRCLRPCPRLYLPVCGADGVTYPNLCTARCSGAPRIPLPRPGVCR